MNSKIHIEIKYLFFSLLMLISSMMTVGCKNEDSDIDDKPVITDFSPKEGDYLTQVTITGSNFGTSRKEALSHVYFNGIEAADYVSYSDNEIVVTVPQGTLTGAITIKKGESYTRSSENFVYKAMSSDGYETGTVMMTLLCKDVVFCEGAKIKPCDYWDENGTSANEIGYFDVTSQEFKYNSGYEGMESKSHALWDWNSGDIAIYKVNVETIGKYYIGLYTSTRDQNCYVNVEIGKDMEALKDVSSINSQYSRDVVFNDSWGDFSNYLEFGPYEILEPVEYYVRFLLKNDKKADASAPLKFIKMFN